MSAARLEELRGQRDQLKQQWAVLARENPWQLDAVDVGRLTAAGAAYPELAGRVAALQGAMSPEILAHAAETKALISQCAEAILKTEKMISKLEQRNDGK